MKCVFWTSGWDSTCRVLDLVIVQRETVRPFYLVDRERPSYELELQTIQKIRDQLSVCFPEALERLQPLEVIEASEIRKEKSITEASDFLHTSKNFGTQYDWLARFVKQQKVGRIEVSFTAVDRARTLLGNLVEREGDAVHVREEFEGTTEHTLFQWFDFPLVLWDRTKVETIEYARANGFLDVLQLSWFCHKPIGNEACGRCTPCYNYVKDGMGHRLPWRARYIRYPVRRVERWLLQTQSPQITSRLRSFKQRFE